MLCRCVSGHTNPSRGGAFLAIERGQAMVAGDTDFADPRPLAGQPMPREISRFRSELAAVGGPRCRTRLPHQTPAPWIASSGKIAGLRWRKEMVAWRGEGLATWSCIPERTWWGKRRAQRRWRAHSLPVERTAGFGSGCSSSSRPGKAAVWGAVRGSGPDPRRHDRWRSVGVCFDTSHALAAGHDLHRGSTIRCSPPSSRRRFDRLSHSTSTTRKCHRQPVDRHEEIGDGYSVLPFWRLVNDPRFAHLPGSSRPPPAPQARSFARNLVASVRVIDAPRPVARPPSQSASHPASTARLKPPANFQGAAARSRRAPPWPGDVAEAESQRLHLQSSQPWEKR